MPTVQGRKVSKSSAEYQAKYGNMPGSKSERSARVSYKEVDIALVAEVVDAVVRAKGAVLLAATSDGGVYSVTFFLGNERAKRYYRDAEELEAGFAEWLEYLRSAEDTAGGAL